jgi:hypothetical protein
VQCSSYHGHWSTAGPVDEAHAEEDAVDHDMRLERVHERLLLGEGDAGVLGHELHVVGCGREIDLAEEPVNLPFGINDDPILKLCTDNGTFEVAAIGKYHHNSTVRRMRDLAIRSAEGLQHDGPNIEGDAIGDHTTAFGCGGLDCGADKDDGVCDEHAAAIICKGPSHEGTDDIA